MPLKLMGRSAADREKQVFKTHLNISTTQVKGSNPNLKPITL